MSGATTATCPSKQRLRLWLRLLRATRSIETDVRNLLRDEFDTTLPRFDVMAALYRAEAGLTMGELSRELMVSNGNVTGIVERLVEDGHVRRGFREGDRRTGHIALTPQGRASFKKMSRAHETWMNRRLNMLDDSELNGAIDLLKRISPPAERTTR
jgi:DNA-binding MarR family transcriptional regulator